jgi:hypothetical protein
MPHFKLDANFKLMSDDERQEAAVLLREMLARLSMERVAGLSPVHLTDAWASHRRQGHPQKPPSKRSRQILLPHNASRSDVRPERFERRVRLVSAIAQGRRWLDDVVSGRVTTVAQLCTREKCSVRQVNMTISLAFLDPILSKQP